MLNVNPLWYKDAIFYEVYVRGFQDSSQDDRPYFISLSPHSFLWFLLKSEMRT